MENGTSTQHRYSQSATIDSPSNSKNANSFHRRSPYVAAASSPRKFVRSLLELLIFWQYLINLTILECFIV